MSFFIEPYPKTGQKDHLLSRLIEGSSRIFLQFIQTFREMNDMSKNDSFDMSQSKNRILQSIWPSA